MNRRRFLLTSTLVVGSSLALGIDASAWERWDFEVTHHDLPLSLPGLTKPLRVAFMSDFHRSCATPRSLIQEAVDLCNAQKPDVVLLGGDYISNDVRLARECAEALRGLVAPMGVFFVLGNHDHWYGGRQVKTALEEAGLQYLGNGNTRITDGLSLCGLDDDWAGCPDMDRAFKGTSDTQAIVLTHNGRLFPRLRDRECTVISGHTHGGQVVIPFLPNPYTLGLRREVGCENYYRFRKYIQGWFHEGKAHLYINRGIGTLSLPFRFRCRPEITVLRVVPRPG